MTTQPDYHADLAATVAACADGGNDAKIIIPVQHARGLLEQVDELRRASARLANLYDAAWLECVWGRRLASQRTSDGTAYPTYGEYFPELADAASDHDAARKEAGL